MTAQFGQWGEQDFVTGKKMRREEPLSSKLQPGQALLLGPVWEWVIMGTPGAEEAPETEPSAASALQNFLWEEGTFTPDTTPVVSEVAEHLPEVRWCSVVRIRLQNCLINYSGAWVPFLGGADSFSERPWLPP